MACPVKSGKDLPTAKQRYELAKLMESLNKQGKKLLELKATLFKEASLTQTSFDERLFDPLVLRYQYDIGTADAMRAYLSDSTQELQFVRSNAEKYHFFLECLQNSFVRPESLSLSSSGIQDPKSKAGNPGKNARAEVASETSAHHACIGTDKTDTFNLHQKVAELNVEHAPSSGANEKQNEDQLSNRDDLSRDNWSNKVTTYPTTLLTNETDTLDDVSEMEFDVAEKYKVFRPKKIRDRKRIFDLFPDPIPPTLPVPKFQSTPLAISFSPEKTIRQGRSVHTQESHSGNHGQDESIHLTNKSKSANESWYEYKERCSVTSLPDHVQQSDPKKPLSPFYLRDYMKTPPYMVTSPTKSIKSVRFSLSPSQSQRQRTSSSRMRNKYPSDTSSDDDEVGFVQQFPCVEKPVTPRRKERRQLHFY